MRKKTDVNDMIKDESAIIKDMVEKKKGKGKKKSSKKKDDKERVMQHKHCIVCFRAITMARDYCSDTCKEIHTTKIKKQRRMLYIMYAVMGIALVFVLMKGMGG